MTVALSALGFLWVIGGVLTGALIVRRDADEFGTIAMGMALVAVVIAVGIIGAFAG